METKVIGVVGAGTMGAGIAQVAAQAGYQIVMGDLNQEFINRGLGIIKKNLERSVAKERFTLQRWPQLLKDQVK